jgi:SAM-dependent methyltransferase
VCGAGAGPPARATFQPHERGGGQSPARRSRGSESKDRSRQVRRLSLGCAQAGQGPASQREARQVRFGSRLQRHPRRAPVHDSQAVALSARDETSRVTLAHYEGGAEEFWLGTRDHDVSQNIDALLAEIGGKPPFRILDLGCGPGRDLRAFASRGHVPTGLDGSSSFVRMAREHAGVEVWEQNFLALDLPEDEFDGVFANASLFHVPSAELPRVLSELRACLRRGGVLFTSNPRGENQEGFDRGRYGAYHDLEHWRAYVTGAGFDEIRHYYRPPGLPREQQPWLATLWRRPETE